MSTQKNIAKVDTSAHLNSPELLQLGQSAIKLLNEGDAKKGKGICIMTYVIAQAWHSKTFEYIVMDNGPKPHNFTLEDVLTGNGLMKDDGKINNKLGKSRVTVIARELFGVVGSTKTNAKTGKDDTEYFTASQRNSFQKALKLVGDLIKLNIRLYDEVKLDEKTNTLMLPQWVFFGQPTNIHLKAVWEKTKHDIMPIGSFEDLLRNVDKEMVSRKLKDKRGTGSKKDPETIFSESIVSITGTANRLANDITTGKDGLTPNMRKQMMSAYLALKRVFDAQDKAEKDAEKQEAKEPVKKSA